VSSGATWWLCLRLCHVCTMTETQQPITTSVLIRHTRHPGAVHSLCHSVQSAVAGANLRTQLLLYSSVTVI